MTKALNSESIADVAVNYLQAVPSSAKNMHIINELFIFICLLPGQRDLCGVKNAHHDILILKIVASRVHKHAFVSNTNTNTHSNLSA